MTAPDAAPVSRGLLIVLGVVVGIAALAALYFFVLAPLLEEEPVTAPTPQQTPADDVDDVEDDEDVGELDERPTPVPETFEVFAARDPFQQLVVEPVAAPSGPGDGTAPADGTAPGTTPGAQPTDPTRPGTVPRPGEPPPRDGVTREPPATRVGATQVRLVDVFVDDEGVTRVAVTVNGSGFEVGEGETFAETFRLLDITDQCATFLFGDSRFTLCRGEEIRK